MGVWIGSAWHDNCPDLQVPKFVGDPNSSAVRAIFNRIEAPNSCEVRAPKMSPCHTDALLKTSFGRDILCSVSKLLCLVNPIPQTLAEQSPTSVGAARWREPPLCLGITFLLFMITGSSPLRGVALPCMKIANAKAI